MKDSKDLKDLKDSKDFKDSRRIKKKVNNLKNNKQKMSRTNFDQLLEAGCHFGHLRRKWNPAMAPYIFMERNGIHIIDLHKTVVKIDEAAEALKQIAKSGKKILFVSTKKQAKDIIAEKATSIGMPYVTERWPGGMLSQSPVLKPDDVNVCLCGLCHLDGGSHRFHPVAESSGGYECDHCFLLFKNCKHSSSIFA